MIFNFPIGYHTFHENNLLITEAGKYINTLVDSKETFKQLVKQH